VTEPSKAWVWSQYRANADERKAPDAALPLLGAFAAGEAESPGGRTRRGVMLAVAMFVGLFFPKIAFLLLIVAILLILSGMEPERFDNFMASVPGGGAVSRVVAIVDVLLR
jgi:hypothetical protein